ncbi:MAG: ABC transporter permease subunit, partial [Planctomycetota bacterium]
MGWIARVPLGAALLFAAAFVVLPLLVMLWETLGSPAAYGDVLTDSTAHAQLLYSAGLGLVATAIAFLLGCGHAWLTFRTDLPGASVLGPLGVAPLVIPPILVAMGFADLADVAGFWSCALLLGVSYAPFVAVLTARGLRSIDGRLYEAALLSRGRLPADRMLFRMALPEITAGCLFAFIFVVSEHGVPEFLTVKGKAWHTYAEGIFARWTRRAMG